jgi:hypothetical protein
VRAVEESRYHALMARMRIKPEDRVRVKLQMLRLLATLRLDR